MKTKLSLQESVLVVMGVLLTGAALVFSVAINLPKSFALSGYDWRAGNIISDKNFYDNSQMSATGIQQWLNQNLTCDTNGDKTSEHSGGVDYNGDGRISRAEWAKWAYGYTGKFVCLTDYYENPTTKENNLVTGVKPAGALSAAEIIKQAADTYQINPKVLLVKLRKESKGPLTSDQWPWPSQFDAALGYACPDPPAGQPVVCDPAYKGFYNQISFGAKGLRNYVTYSDSYRYKPFRVNSILYSPITSCGSTDVYIENYATAGLYNYTPYQPNKAALDNLYGEGDGCSAYGNRNFWIIYTDMFGPTIDNRIGMQPSSSSKYAKAACNVPYYDSSNVLRLYQPDTRDFLYTTNRLEACLAVSYGYIFDGAVMLDAKDDPDKMPVFRIANYERHIFTTSPTVRDDYINKQDYHDEGIAFYVNSTEGSGKLPVTGLQRGQTFFFTSSGKEAANYTNDDYFNFGTIFYTRNMSGTESQTPVYRLTNRWHTRLYTTSALERDLAIKNYGYLDEGVVSTNDAWPNENNAPMYRLRSPWGTYFYTNSRHERDMAIINYDYYAEAIPFYSVADSGKPVYRALNPQTAQRIYTNSSLEYDLALARYGYVGEDISWYGY